MSSTKEGRGYGIKDPKKYTDFKPYTYPLKTQGPHDVTLDIECCGVCGSDVHTVTGGWSSEFNSEFVVPGHEIIGTVTHVGEQVKEFKVGQRVGVGAQVYSCLECNRCKEDNENYCKDMVDTYNAKYPDGVIAQGGFSTAVRVHDRFVFTIPDNISSEEAAPLLCAGLTTYSPLTRNGTGPGKTVGIVGIGGLGHLAVQIAHALGAKVIVFSHSDDKEADAKKFGADEFVNTGKDGFADKYFDKLDYLLSCADVEKLPLADLLSTLKVGGNFTSVGLPDNAWEGLQPMMFMANAATLGATHVGSKKEANAMLKLCSEKGVRPIIDKVYPMSQAGEAIERVKNNDVRYRFVLKQDLKENGAVV